MFQAEPRHRISAVLFDSHPVVLSPSDCVSDAKIDQSKKEDFKDADINLKVDQ